MGNFAPDLPDVRESARVGLLGGSFDPAHEGHVAISLRAMRQAQLDWVWWMINPQNPLKNTPSMSLCKRLAHARRLVRHPLRRIWVSDIEARLGTGYTVNTVQALRQRYPRVRFVLLMGSDNLVELLRWRDWHTLARLLPLLVIPRGVRTAVSAGFEGRGLYHGHIIPSECAHRLAEALPPAVCFLSGAKIRLSSTQLRKEIDGF
ncbi:MAG: nicotinate-nucleotide adenylyltransferase [Hyphomicrobiales bacterium]|nr:nicotinate-nucleotide adenylyltransferase [Hyphomicrobiales bacterium]